MHNLALQLANLAPPSKYNAPTLIGGLLFFLGWGVIVTAINAKDVSHITKGKIVAVGIILLFVGAGLFALRTT